MSMQQPIPAARSASSRSFAGLLADFAAPGDKLPPARDLDGLADDVATLSYEQALRSRSRPHPVPHTADHKRALKSAPIPKHPIQPTVERTASGVTAGPPSTSGSQTSGRRCSSVTVRLSSPESEQLHLRAAEAGLNVSAYLRSCAFEVETLRAEVKATLAQLRSQSTPSERNPVSPSPRRPWLRFLTRAIRLKSRN